MDLRCLQVQYFLFFFFFFGALRVLDSPFCHMITGVLSLWSFQLVKPGHCDTIHYATCHNVFSSEFILRRMVCRLVVDEVVKDNSTC